MKRWLVTVNYRATPTDIIVVEHELEELYDLQALIEAGPNWNCIESIQVNLLRVLVHSICLEDVR